MLSGAPLCPKNASDKPNALLDVLKQGASEIPVLAQLLKIQEKLKQDQFNRSIVKILTFLKEKVDDPELLFSDEWLRSEEGQTFARKVFASALDAQLADKQQLFVNALINGIENKQLPYHEKLKFTDMIRHLSLPALMILSKIHQLYENRPEATGFHDLSPDSFSVNRMEVVQKLGNQYDPHLIESCLDEMRGYGVFSSTGTYFRDNAGKYQAGFPQGGYIYSAYTHRFVKFLLRET